MQRLLLLFTLVCTACRGGTLPSAEHRDAAADAGACAPDDARGEGPCEAVVAVVWDGTRCGMTSGCSCVGRDCKRWRNLAECETAHAACRDR